MNARFLYDSLADRSPSL